MTAAQDMNWRREVAKDRTNAAIRPAYRTYVGKLHDTGRPTEPTRLAVPAEMQSPPKCRRASALGRTQSFS